MSAGLGRYTFNIKTLIRSHYKIYTRSSSLPPPSHHHHHHHHHHTYTHTHRQFILCIHVPPPSPLSHDTLLYDSGPKITIASLKLNTSLVKYQYFRIRKITFQASSKLFHAFSRSQCIFDNYLLDRAWKFMKHFKYHVKISILNLGTCKTAQKAC